MRKLTLFAVILMAGMVVAVGCKKAEKTPEGTPGAAVEEKGATAKDTATNDVIGEKLSKSLCKRMVECKQGIMTEEDCVAQTKTSLLEALAEKNLSITTAQLDACVNKIDTCECAEVMGTEPPQGCEFLN